MDGELTVVTSGVGTHSGFDTLPAIITDAGERARSRFVEFFTATIRIRTRAPTGTAGITLTPIRIIAIALGS
jgi:hypothetical protein